MNKTNVGKKLRELRTSQKLTREELAGKLGASVSAIAMYENGERTPRDEMKYKIAVFFGVSLESLFFSK